MEKIVTTMSQYDIDDDDDTMMMIIIQVYNLFRQLGLRHLLVVPRASRVIGMISRKDLLIEVILGTYILLQTCI